MTTLANNLLITDEALVHRAQMGDTGAFEQLVTRHAERLGAALRQFGLDVAETQDVAQDAFLRAWRALPRFEQRASFSTWLHRIAFNEAHRRLARRKPAHVADGRDRSQIADPRPGPGRHAEAAELRMALAHALEQLPVHLRAPVVLRDVQGLSTEQAALILGLSEGALKSRLRRGRMTLRDQLSPLISQP